MDDETGLPISWTVRATLWRVAASILAPVLWLSGVLLYFAFWAHGLSLLQGIVVGVVAVITLFGVMAAMWVSWGMSVARRWIEG